MTERRSPTVRRRRLGAELRRHREEAGVTIESAARRLGFSTSKVSRIETGHTRATPADVSALLGLYDVAADEAEQLVDIAHQARQKGWWHPYSTVLTGAYVGLEAAAVSVWAYEQQVVPGLLQTERYAAAIMRAARSSDTDEEIARRVRVRMARQSLLTQDDPIDLWVVLDEAVVSRPVGGDAVMRDQLARLAEAAARPNVTLQLLPFAAGAHAGMDGPFAILHFPDDQDPDVVLAENAAGGVVMERRDEVAKYADVFAGLRDAALPPDASTETIAMLAKEPLWNSRARVTPST